MRIWPLHLRPPVPSSSAAVLDSTGAGAVTPATAAPLCQSFIGHSAPVTCLLFSHCGGLAVSSDAAGAILLWDLQRCDDRQRRSSAGEATRLVEAAQGCDDEEEEEEEKSGVADASPAGLETIHAAGTDAYPSAGDGGAAAAVAVSASTGGASTSASTSPSWKEMDTVGSPLPASAIGATRHPSFSSRRSSGSEDVGANRQAEDLGERTRAAGSAGGFVVDRLAVAAAVAAGRVMLRLERVLGG